jgi:hypothetical protein
MSSILIALIVFACTVVGMLLGMLLRRLVPDHHLKDESKDVLRTATGLIATLVALILALLVGSAKSSFDAMNTGLTQISAKAITLHRVLVRYGPESKDAQDLQRRTLAASVERIWPADKTKSADLAAVQAATGAEDAYQRIQQLSPQTDAQRSLKAQALQIAADIQQARWLLIEQTQASVPMLFLVVMIFWLTVLYASFGLSAPPHATPIVALVISALSVSAAVFMILEMNHPLQGMMKVSSAPLQKALEVMGQ